MKLCLNCGEQLSNEKRTFCSRSCAAKFRMNRLSKANSVTVNDVPVEVYDILSERYGKDTARDMIRESGGMVFATPNIAKFASERTYGDMYTSNWLQYSENELRNRGTYSGGLTYTHIKEMLRCGQVLFGLSIKKAPIENTFRNERSILVDFDGGSQVFRNKIGENIVMIMQRYIHDFMSMLEYGVSINELVWSIDKNIAVVDKINSVNPETVSKILLTKDGSFNGFEQDTVNGNAVVVPVEQSLLLSYNKKFRNLWGESILNAVYPFYFWYDVVWRSFVRYLEKSGTPVVVASAPSRLKVVSKNGASVDAMEIAEQLAYKVSRSPAVAIPSDRDQDGNPLWTISYLKSDYDGEQFESALKLLGIMILRSLLVTDTVATQLDTGSFNLGSIHYQVVMLDNERILSEILTQMNKYLCSRYILFNYGSNSNVRVRLRTCGLNVSEQEMMVDLLKAAISSKLSVANEIDYRKVGEICNVPFLSEEQIRESVQPENIVEVKEDEE